MLDIFGEFLEIVIKMVELFVYLNKDIFLYLFILRLFKNMLKRYGLLIFFCVVFLLIIFYWYVKLLKIIFCFLFLRKLVYQLIMNELSGLCFSFLIRRLCLMLLKVLEKFIVNIFIVKVFCLFNVVRNVCCIFNRVFI